MLGYSQAVNIQERKEESKRSLKSWCVAISPDCGTTSAERGGAVATTLMLSPLLLFKLYSGWAFPLIGATTWNKYMGFM